MIISFQGASLSVSTKDANEGTAAIQVSIE